MRPPTDHLARVRRSLERDRARGLSFEAAWREALLWRRDGSVGGDYRTWACWRAILEVTEAEWRAAYERTPTPVSAALEALPAASTVPLRGTRVAA